MAGCHLPPRPFTGDRGLQTPHPYSCPHPGRARQPRVSPSEPVAARSMTSSSGGSLLCCPLQPPPVMAAPGHLATWNCSTLEIAESGAPSLPTACRPSSPLLVPCGTQVPDSAGCGALLPPLLPLCLHSPPSPAEVPWSIIRALFCQHPQLSWPPISWSRLAGSPPALEGSQQPPAWRRPPPSPLLGAKLEKPAALGG